MTLERRIQLTIGVILVSVLIMGAALLWSSRQVEHGFRAIRASVEIVRSTFMLKVVLHEYADYGDKRSLKQWQIYRDRLDKVLSQKEIFESIDKRVLGTLEHDYRDVNSLASRMTQMRASENAQESDLHEKALRQTLLGMMSRRLEELVVTAQELELACESFTLSRQELAQNVIVAIGILMVLLILASLYLIRRSIVNPLKQLSIGAMVVGAGNFDYVLDTKNDDEVGRVARSFNSMAERLKRSYDSLNAEITERQRAQEALEATSAYNRSLIEASLDPLVTISADGKITDVNTRTERVTGCSRNELIGTDFADYFTDPEKARAGYQQVFRDGAVRDYELVIRHRTGQLTPVMYNASVYRDESGNIIGVFAGARDITEIKRAELERERLITELEAKNAELERFTYSVSHDLRSPLITIKTFLGFVAEHVVSGKTEDLKSDLDRIDRAAEKMGNLLDEILELSRIGRMFNPPSQVPMADLANEALDLLSGRIAQNPVQVEIASDLPVLYGDRLRLREVFQNLIENSMKFMGDQPHPRIEVGATKSDGETVLFIRDNGIGIDPRYREKVFGLFDKLDQKSDGTGIGLALVKRIVEVHGGRIWVESDGPGQGSTFYFSIPRPVAVG